MTKRIANTIKLTLYLIDSISKDRLLELDLSLLISTNFFLALREPILASINKLFSQKKKKKQKIG